MRLKGRTALVTGASRNIGRAIALAFAQEGANLVVHGHGYSQGAEETAAAARGLGSKAITVTADVGDPGQVKAMVDRALSEFGGVDILVNNAGYRPGGSTLELTPEAWRRVVAVNLDGPFFCAQAVLPGMVAQRWGRIINISGISAFLGHRREPAVSASKAGLLGLTHALAAEFAHHNILVNTVVPGLIRIDPSPSIPHLPDFDQAATRLPLGRVGQPTDVAALCVLLASEEGGFITGQTLHVNGGHYFT